MMPIVDGVIAVVTVAPVSLCNMYYISYGSLRLHAMYLVVNTQNSVKFVFVVCYRETTVNSINAAHTQRTFAKN